MLAALMGRAAPGVINGALPASISGDPGAALQLVNDGSYTATGLAGGSWVTPGTTTTAAYYQAKVDVTGGALGVGSSSTGTWLDLSTTRAWGVDDPLGSAEITISIREKATGIVRSQQTGIQIFDV
jgi:hypothetical protein